MVYQHRNIMTFVDIFAHIDILRRKRRGIQPEEIYNHLYASYTMLYSSTFYPGP